MFFYMPFSEIIMLGRVEMNLSEFFRKFRKGLFTKAQFVTGATISLMVTSALVWAFTHSSITTFNQDDVISSTEMNNNFAYVKERLDKLAGGKFVLATTSVVNLATPTTSHCCKADYLFPITFDVAVEDFSTHGQDYLSNGNIVVQESGLYQMILTGRIQNPTSNYGSIVVARKDPGSSTYSMPLNLTFYNTTNFDYKSSNSSIFLNSGTTIQIRGSADKYGPNGANVDFDTNISFSFKKL